MRVAAKELTALLLDEERLRNERKDRHTWKSRVSGLDERPPTPPVAPRRQVRTQPPSDDNDMEYRLALEASKFQEEEDRKKRESQVVVGEDADLAKAIKLSQEEDEARRRRELEQKVSIFDHDTASTPQATQPVQPMYTSFNQGYQQGSAVDFWANPINPNQFQPQQTGFIPSAYTGIPQQQTAFQQPQPTSLSANPYTNGLGGPQLQQNPTAFQPQQTAFNSFNQQPQLTQSEPEIQPNSNNPWAISNNNNSLQQAQSGIKPLGSDSNNPFGASYGRQSTFKTPLVSTLGALPESSPLTTFPQSTPFAPSQPAAFNPPSKPLTDHEAKLNTLLSNTDGMDTFGNTGNLRIPAQHTAPGTFVNSAGAGLGRLTTDPTGSNPFLRTQMTGMPSLSYGVGQQTTGFPAINGGQSNNPFAAGPPQHNSQSQDLISFTDN